MKKSCKTEKIKIHKDVVIEVATEPENEGPSLSTN